MRCVVSKRLQVLFREVFFPSAGFRSAGAGSLTSIGYRGDFWSLSASASGGARLRFIDSGAVFDGLDRSYGFSLRCVQGFAGFVCRMVFPVCGVPRTAYGNGVGYRLLRILFLLVSFKYGCLASALCRRLWQYGCGRWPYVCVRCALCPSVYRFCFGLVFFPSAGFRSNTTGVSGVVGSNGYVSLSLSSGAYALCSLFQPSGSYLNAEGGRTHGFPLRCVQAFTGSVSGCLLPGCGESSPRNGSADERGFRRGCMGCFRVWDLQPVP